MFWDNQLMESASTLNAEMEKALFAELYHMLRLRAGESLPPDMFSQHLEPEEFLLGASAALAMAITDDHFQILAVNRSFEWLLGKKQTDLQGVSIEKMPLGLVDASQYGKLSETIARGEIWRGDITGPGSTGEPLWLRCTLVPLPATKKHFGRLLVFYTDITDIHRTEMQLSLTLDVLNLSSDAIHVADESGRLIYVNQRSGKNLGYSREELLGKPVYEIERIFDDLTAWQKHMEEVKHHPDGMLVLGENIRKDGTPFPVEVNVRYLELNGRGYIVAVLRDITERMKQEEELRKRNRDLDQFAQIVSHDLKAPLRAIHNLSDWLEEENQEMPEAMRSRLDLMRKRVVRMENLINGILEYSSAGKRKNHPEWVSLNRMVDELFDTFLDSYPGVGLQREDLPDVETDRLGLFQVLSNLISNALKHNRQEIVPLVRISCQQREGEIEICVEDNGPGIDPLFHQKIFDMFQTLRPRDETENTGVGLSIVRKIAEENGWMIHLESQKNRGSRFYLKVPISES